MPLFKPGLTTTDTAANPGAIRPRDALSVLLHVVRSPSRPTRIPPLAARRSAAAVVCRATGRRPVVAHPFSIGCSHWCPCQFERMAGCRHWRVSGSGPGGTARRPSVRQNRRARPSVAGSSAANSIPLAVGHEPLHRRHLDAVGLWAHLVCQPGMLQHLQTGPQRHRPPAPGRPDS